MIVSGALAQDQTGAAFGTNPLPERCQAGMAGHQMPDLSDMMQIPPGMGDHGRAMMEGMMKTQLAMMQGLLAFACAMIMHHRAAIEMAKVELEQGNDDTVKRMAQTRLTISPTGSMIRVNSPSRTQSAKAERA